MLKSTLVDTIANESLLIISFLIEFFFLHNIFIALNPSLNIFIILKLLIASFISFLLGPPKYKYFIYTF